jgi:hypothetical protein
MTRFTCVLTGTLILGFMSCAAFAQELETSIYKWVDEEGVTNYGSLPPDWETAERTHVHARRSNSQVLQSNTEEKATQNQVKKIRKNQERTQAGEAANERSETTAQAAEKCQQAKQQLKTYSEAMRLFRTDENGERVFLSDDEIDSTRADAIKAVNQWCGRS